MSASWWREQARSGLISSEKMRLLGPVADMQSLFAAADMFILPTVYDPFSNACLEALSYGLPVITTLTNGFSEIVESGTPWGNYWSG